MDFKSFHNSRKKRKSEHKVLKMSKAEDTGHHNKKRRTFHCNETESEASNSHIRSDEKEATRKATKSSRIKDEGRKRERLNQTECGSDIAMEADVTNNTKKETKDKVKKTKKPSRIKDKARKRERNECESDRATEADVTNTEKKTIKVKKTKKPSRIQDKSRKRERNECESDRTTEANATDTEKETKVKKTEKPSRIKDKSRKRELNECELDRAMKADVAKTKGKDRKGRGDSRDLQDNVMDTDADRADSKRIKEELEDGQTCDKKMQKKNKRHRRVSGLNKIKKDNVPHSFNCQCKHCKILCNRGKWSVEEVSILGRNLDTFAKENNIKDIRKKIFKSGWKLDSGDVVEWKKFAKETNFYVKMCEGLNRNMTSVYKGLETRFSHRDRSGSYTDKEIEQLKVLHLITGPKWKIIGDQMGRHGTALQRKLLKLQGRRGAWTDVEIDHLAEAVGLLTGTNPGTPVFKGIKWQMVSAFVETRNAYQCWKRWVIHTPKQVLKDDLTRWSLKDSLELITRVYDSEANEESQIDWEQISENWKEESTTSPQKLASKWCSVKRKYLKDHTSMTFEDMLDELHDVHAPKLRMKVASQEKLKEEMKVK